MEEIAKVIQNLAGTLGPVGAVVALCYCAYLLYGPNGYKRQQRVETVVTPVAPVPLDLQMIRDLHSENRDRLIQIDGRTERGLDMQEKELELLRVNGEITRDIVKHQERLASTMISVLEHLANFKTMWQSNQQSPRQRK